MTIAHVGLIVLILGGVIFGSYWIQVHYLHVPRMFVIAVTGGSSIALSFTAVYAYRIGYLRQWGGPGHDVARRIASFRRKFRLLVFSLIAAVPLFLAITTSFVNVTVGVLLLLLSLVICPWALRKVTVAWRDNPRKMP